MRSRLWLLMGVLVLAVGVTTSSAAEPSADEAAIRKSVMAYVEAYQKRDAKALAALWSTDAEYVSSASGKRFHGRQAIQQEFARVFALGPSQLEVTVRSIRFVSPDVALEEGDARVTAAGEAPEDSTYMAVHVKRDGKWQLNSVRETELPSRSSSYQHLRDLEWMLGTWIDESDEATVETTCQWTRNKNFMTRNFKIILGEQVDVEGTQMIGWDAAAGTIRSWVFDSDGGFSEGIWTRSGDRWVIKTVGTLPDGGQATAVNILTRIDDDTATWQTTGRDVDGEILPNLDPVTIKRRHDEDANKTANR